MRTADRGQPSVSARKWMSASLAAPSTGGAVTLILISRPRGGPISFLAARGCQFHRQANSRLIRCQIIGCHTRHDAPPCAIRNRQLAGPFHETSPHPNPLPSHRIGQGNSRRTRFVSPRSVKQRQVHGPSARQNIGVEAKPNLNRNLNLNLNRNLSFKSSSAIPSSGPRRRHGPSCPPRGRPGLRRPA